MLNLTVGSEMSVGLGGVPLGGRGCVLVSDQKSGYGLRTSRELAAVSMDGREATWGLDPGTTYPPSGRSVKGV